MTEIPLFSIIAPMLNEAESVAPLAREIAVACAPIGAFEAIFVNDGSNDGTAGHIAMMQIEFPWLRAVHHARPCGQSSAIRSGVIAARAPVICTIDGDGQNPPAEIPKLVAPLLTKQSHPSLGLVVGQRLGRRDSVPRKLASHLANRLRAMLLQDDTSDTGCGLKAFPRAVFLALPFFDHMHRYLPALVRREGFNIALVDVAHRPRLYGTSKYSITGRAFAGIQDLLGVWWLMRRRRLADIPRPDQINPDL
jgi:dolichol-phosphate mannosyltransferase